MKGQRTVLWFGKIIAGCLLFALGFDMFLEPNGLNAGGISGLAMILVHVLGFGSVGVVTALMNLPLFLSAFSAALCRPPQQGTSMRTMVTLFMSLFLIMSVSFSV